MWNKGKPSGINKSEKGTGVPSNINIKPANLKEDGKLTEKYTDDDKDVAKQVRVKNPNRNVDKRHAANIHGYRG